LKGEGDLTGTYRTDMPIWGAGEYDDGDSGTVANVYGIVKQVYYDAVEDETVLIPAWIIPGAADENVAPLVTDTFTAFYYAAAGVKPVEFPEIPAVYQRKGPDENGIIPGLYEVNSQIQLLSHDFGDSNDLYIGSGFQMGDFFIIINMPDAQVCEILPASLSGVVINGNNELSKAYAIAILICLGNDVWMCKIIEADPEVE
jgi:hypothetical protein